jgi:uncharacterized protein (TIGR03435 family)
MPGGTFRATHVTTFTLIRMAFDLEAHQLMGGPGWLESDRYDIIAKPERASSKEEVKAMVQSLLVDRFKLAYHHDARELAGYVITVAKDGPKLHAADPAVRAQSSNGRGLVTTTKASLQFLANSLAYQLRCPVQDKTGLAGIFDFRLEWTPEQAARMAPADGKPGEESTLAADPTGGSLFTAIQEQLGLRLHPQKISTETFVVDHVDKPSEN